MARRSLAGHHREVCVLLCPCLLEPSRRTWENVETAPPGRFDLDEVTRTPPHIKPNLLQLPSCTTGHLEPVRRRATSTKTVGGLNCKPCGVGRYAVCDTTYSAPRIPKQGVPPPEVQPCLA